MIFSINEKYQAMEVRDSSFGQLGYSSADQVFSSTAIPLLEEFMVQEIFCTSFCTFLLTSFRSGLIIRMWAQQSWTVGTGTQRFDADPCAD